MAKHMNPPVSKALDQQEGLLLLKR
jgi:hypothetical protein